METTDLKKLATILIESNQYRVSKKYQKPEFYNIEDDSDKLIGVFLDIEATGLSYATDKIIELGVSACNHKHKFQQSMTVSG